MKSTLWKRMGQNLLSPDSLLPYPPCLSGTFILNNGARVLLCPFDVITALYLYTVTNNFYIIEFTFLKEYQSNHFYVCNEHLMELANFNRTALRIPSDYWDQEKTTVSSY